MSEGTLRIKLPTRDIVNLYLYSGESINRLASYYGVSRGTITKRLSRAKVKLRTQSQSEKLKWSHMTPKQRKHQVKAAHDSVRGRRKTRDYKLRHAKGRQAKPKLYHLERLFLRAFRDAHIKVIPQYALDIFNIDFAIPLHKLAIEIDGGNWHTTKHHQHHDKLKEDYLSTHGWRLIRFSTHRVQIEKILHEAVERVRTIILTDLSD